MGNRVPVHWTPLPHIFGGCLCLFWQLPLHPRFYDAARILNCSFACCSSCIIITKYRHMALALYSALYLPFISGVSVRWVRSCAKSIKMITTIPKKNPLPYIGGKIHMRRGCWRWLYFPSLKATQNRYKIQEQR